MQRDYIIVFINGKRVEVQKELSFYTLSNFLRNYKKLIGTKIVCEEGDCGACTVLIGKINGKDKIEYKTVNSCIQFMAQLDFCHIVTVEGISKNGTLHQVQKSMVEHFGSQCGFCTPGFVMAMVGTVEKDIKLDVPQIKNELTGNLCRCTGYDAIINAGLDLNNHKIKKISEYYPDDYFNRNFLDNKLSTVLIEFTEDGEKFSFYKPVTLKEACNYLNNNKQVKLIAGATDVGVQVNKGRIFPKQIMCLSSIENLENVVEKDDSYEIGSLATWTKIENCIQEDFEEFFKILNVFASPQIKNVATIGGNIINGSPIADSLPFLYVMDAVLELNSEKGKREVNINNFFTGYKKFDLKEDELLTKVIVRKSKKNEILKLYKISKRKDLDISIFTAGFQFSVNQDQITDCKIALGGVGPNIIRLKEVEKYFIGKEIEEELFLQAGEIANREITPISDVRASREYRESLTNNIFKKVYIEKFKRSAAFV